MMPVIGVSEKTWERMKKHARPFEESPDDVINIALDALDEHGALPRPEAQVRSEQTPRRHGKKLPQKEFRLPLLETLRELGGKSGVREIRKRMEPKVAPRLSEADHASVSTGEP